MRKLTIEDFIRKAKEVHGDKYDYSKVIYKGVDTPVTIICPIHGEFQQTPYHHINRKQGCGKCADKLTSKRFSSTTDEFIRKSVAIHGDKYDYSKVVYKKAIIPVTIICPEHGEFQQTPHDHLRYSGCPKCAVEKRMENNSQRLSSEEFIKRSVEKHGDKYDYSKVKYVNSVTLVSIVCPEHGEFMQLPQVHMNGCGCPKCVGKEQITKEDFINKAREIHGDKYDYSKVEYKGTDSLVTIICPEHGEFMQTPYHHLKRRQGCPKCARRIITTEDFINKAREIHGDKYDYSKVVYKNSKTDVCVICPEHGEFLTNPTNHLSGHGCPNCYGFRKWYKFNLLQEFESEYELRAFLENNDVNILYVILRNVEPKFEPIKGDIEKALKNIELKDPIQALEDKYAKDDEEEIEETSTDKKEEETATIDITNVDLDDENAVNDVIGNEDAEEEEDTNTEPTIEDVVKNTEKELEVISKIEHMLTPEDREYIMEKFLNDKLRDWMANREASKND